MNGAIIFTCPHGRATFRGPDELRGRTGQCPECDEEITVPTESPDAHDGPAAAAEE
jgi:hypothetical protein